MLDPPMVGSNDAIGDVTTVTSGGWSEQMSIEKNKTSMIPCLTPYSAQTLYFRMYHI